MFYPRHFLSFRLMGIALFIMGILAVARFTYYGPSPAGAEENHITFLHQKQLLPSADVLKADWVSSLRSIASSRQTRRASDNLLITVFGTSSYYNVLINWLAALRKNTGIDVRDVLIVVTEEELHVDLKARQFTSLYVRKESLISSSEDRTMLNQTLIIRCAVARLLNHWGLDVAMVDVDAVVLRDPRDIFRRHPEAQIIASRGTYPTKQFKLWKLTLCMGFVLFRSSAATEMFWDVASTVSNDTVDDQVRINTALNDLDVRWYTERNCTKVPSCVVYGRARGGLGVVVLPGQMVCRHCNKKWFGPELFIWHQLGAKIGITKEKLAKERHMWYLKPDWKKISSESDLVGEEWLRQITRTNL